MRLFINDFLIELKPDVKIAKTIQSNDIGSVNTRQANYTNTFEIPKTSSNIKALQMLGIEGNDSNIPYQKNECSLFADSGEAIVYKGWAVISETDETFKCNIYDGIVDLYKAIQNFTLADLDITELQHDKTPANILASQDLSLPYAYILADYNGRAMVGTNIESDYLVPSVKISWLMDKISAFSGYNFEGSYKTNPDYTNLYLTTPKSTPPVITGTLLTSSDINPDRIKADTTPPLMNVEFNSATITGLKIYLDSNKKTIFANQNVKIKVTFVLDPNIQFIDSNGDVTYAYAIFNGQGFVCDGTVRTISTNYDLLLGDSIEFQMMFFDTANDDFVIPDFLTSCLIQEFTNDSLFEKEIGGLKITDFLNEIIWRFNLTIFKNDNGYILKYLNEILNAVPLDWSDKFIEKTSENYIYGNYGQINDFKLRYDDDNSKFNDGSISVINTNLPDEKTAIKSITYSPDFNTSTNIGFESNVYKFYDKEVQDNGDVKYKPLSNRFFFIKPIPVTLATNLQSSTLGITLPITGAQRESFLNLDYKKIVENYYLELSQLLNKSKIVTITARLNELDIANVDLSKPVYLKQLGGSYLINKISNFIPYQNTKVELIKINK